MPVARRKVSVIGLGAMGTALAQACLKAGHDVTVWNRTTEKCEALKHLGAHVASSLTEALDFCEIGLVCLLDFEANKSLFFSPEITSHVKGKTFVQMATVTSEEAKRTEAWAKREGISYLDAAILGYPKSVGTPDLMIIYAGLKTAYEKALPVLECLGQARYIGDNVQGIAALNLSLFSSFMVGSTLAFLHGAACCQAQEVPLETYLSIVQDYMIPKVILGTLNQSVPMINNKTYTDQQVPLNIWAPSIEMARQLCIANNVNSTYPETIFKYIEEAKTLTDGQQNGLVAIFECFKKKVA